MTPRRRRVALAALLAVIPGAVWAADEVDPRGDVETMEALLDRVVRRVSQPSAAPFFGATEASRAYRLQGYGVVFVVPPRALPPSDRMGTDLRSWDPQASARDTRDLPGDPSSPAHPSQEPASRMSASGPRGAKAQTARERELQAIEAKVDALSREAERQRAEAERALAAAMLQVQRRLAMPDPQPAPGAPRSPIQMLPPGPGSMMDPPPAPPWRYWLNSDDSDDPRSADDVVRDVKAAVSQAVEAAGGRLRSIRPEEFVVVAIDFVPQWDFGDGARAERTLVVRVRKKDLVDHESGKLGSDDLRKRIEYVEY
jgi:hypothetical protein